MTTTADHIELETMPGYAAAMQRVYAWFAGEIIDRPPVRFFRHNDFVEQVNQTYPGSLRERWFDAEFQVDMFVRSITGKTFHGETFPVFWPNLGPEVYAALYGSELIYSEYSSYAMPLVRTWDDLARLRLDFDNAYAAKLDEMTRHALEQCAGRFLVGYTDLHPGVDCAAAWRDPQQLCMDMIDSPEAVQQLIDIAIRDFETIYDRFDSLLKASGQPSASWMCIPSSGRMHIPSCDFSALISPAFFERYCLPVLQREVQTMTHNIFHIDGYGVARHLEMIASVPQVHAFQWVQGAGRSRPIMQWVPLIQRMQALRPVIVDLDRQDLDAFMDAVRPEGIFLWVDAGSEAEELNILRRVSAWR